MSIIDKYCQLSNFLDDLALDIHELISTINDLSDLEPMVCVSVYVMFS